MKCPQKRWQLEARRALTPPISRTREGQKLMGRGKNEVRQERLRSKKTRSGAYWRASQGVLHTPRRPVEEIHPPRSLDVTIMPLWGCRV